MTQIIKNLTFALTAVAGLTLSGTNVAQAQYPPYYPQQPIVINNPYYPQQTVIHPSALQPGAQAAIPGTQQSYQYYVPGTGWVTGTKYIGLDGQWHGNTNITDSSGFTQQHFYAKNPMAKGSTNKTGTSTGKTGSSTGYSTQKVQSAPTSYTGSGYSNPNLKISSSSSTFKKK